MNEVLLVDTSGGLIARQLLTGLRRERCADPIAAPASFVVGDGPRPTAKEHAADVDLALQTLATRWDNVKDGLGEMDTTRVRERWLLPLLRELGFAPVFLRGGLPAGGVRFTVTHRGWDAEGAPPILLTGGDLDARPAGGGRGPHDELQAFLNASDEHRWGIVVSPTRLRIVRDYHHRRTRGYVEWDLDAIFETRSYPDFLCFYRLAHASRFVPGDDGADRLEAIHQRSLDAGVTIGRQLQPQVHRALETIANGVADAELLEALRDPARARAFHRELLVFLYRVLFLLFAERRGLLPNSGIYAESYAVSRLRELAGQGAHAVEPRRGDLWEGLKVTFRALGGEGAEAIEAFPFDGPLFNATRTPTLSAARCENRVLLRAVDALTSVQIEGVRQHVNYGDLGVEEIGSVYESLLDYLPTVNSGQIDLRPVSEERSDLGSYYTPRELVELVLSKSLDRVIAERLEAAGDDPNAREAALLEITVIDPACGSAAFLITAVDRLALALAEVRRQGRPDDRDLRQARRDVLQRCIYAVDKDETAVELAKVALWIHCAVEDRPLTFLDHRIQHGDSLVGWPLLGPLPRAIPDEAFESKSSDSREEKRERRAWLERNRERQLSLEAHAPPTPDPHLALPTAVTAAEDSADDVQAKAAAYAAYRASELVRRFEHAADLWTAAFFWSAEAGAAPTTHEYWLALRGERVEQAEEVGRLAAQVPFFHWALRFPEIRERGGFDCVIGNPPWKQYKTDEREWFASRAPGIAALASGDRKRAIDALAETKPELDSAWRRHQAAVERLAEFARHSGRYTPSGAEANTYLLFAELVADIARPGARAGVLLKSQLALDTSSQALFQRLLDEGRVAEVHDIVNGGPTGTNLVFPNVDAKERFSVVALTGIRGEADGFAATVMNWNVEEAATRMPRTVTRGMLATLNPRTRSLTSFRRNEELEVALDLHRRLATLDFEKGGKNPWGIAWVTLFHSSGANKKGLFHKREDLEAEGWVLGADKAFRRGELVACPLYEGQLVNRYDHRARTYEGYTGDNKYKPAPGIPETTDSQKANPDFEVEPRYWMLAPVVEKRLREKIGDRVMLGFGNTGRAWREQRSTAGALLPRVPATHGLPILAVDRDHALEFAALFNSTVFDFRARGGMPGANLGLAWMLSQVVAPQPGLDPRVADNSARLSLTSRSVARLLNRPPCRWEPHERYRLNVETDALVAHAYGLDTGSYVIVLDSFEVMMREQVKQYGYYKLKDDCLAAFDRVTAEVPVGSA